MAEIVKNDEKDRADVRALIEENGAALEDGISIIENDVMVDDDLIVDFLAKDGKGKPVVILIEDKERGGEAIAKLLLILNRLKKHRVFLERIYRDHGFSFAAAPRVFVLAPEMTDDFVYCLESLKAVKVVPCEYSFLKLEDRVYFTVTPRKGEKSLRAMRVGIEAPAAKAPAAKAPAAKASAAKAPAPPVLEEEPVSDAEESGEEDEEGEEGGGESRSPEEYYRIALEKIKKISSKMVEAQDGNLTRFKIDEKTLASLAVQSEICYVFLGEKKDKAIKITSEKILNETLNQVYKLYATQFGPAKTA